MNECLRAVLKMENRGECGLRYRLQVSGPEHHVPPESALGKRQVVMPGTATEHGTLPGPPGTQLSQRRENLPGLLGVSSHTTTGYLVKRIWTPMV